MLEYWIYDWCGSTGFVIGAGGLDWWWSTGFMIGAGVLDL